MNLLDILIAKKKSFTGETESLVRRANEAMAAANTVADKIEDAGDLLSAAQTANETAQSVAANLQELQTNLTNAAANVVDDRIELALSNLNLNNVVTSTTVEENSTTAYKNKNIIVVKNGNETNYNIEKNYTATGSNEDGAMTQKAITAALNNQKIYLENKINAIPTGSGSGEAIISFSSDDAGSLVSINNNGNLAPSSISEDDIIQAQIALGIYNPINVLGVEIDYDNRLISRLSGALNLNAGTDFDAYPMYGGRKRCVVSDNGEIVAFYGDANYTEDGSIGQVMVYQPKFYYMRIPLKLSYADNRNLISKERIYVSATKQAGFTIHPVFLDQNDHELNYILLSAYEGSTYDSSANNYNLNDTQNIDFSADLLSSIANAKPASGIAQAFNLTNAEQLAQNRGASWHLTNFMAESMNQMLMIIEFGSLNIQNAFNKGITELTEKANANISCLTGATNSLGNTSGMASQTSDGTTTYNVEGKNAISYRGVENLYGNMWTLIGDVKIITQNGNQYLTYKNNRNETKTFATAITNTTSWISYFGYDTNATWAFVPAQCAGANSAVPVGDYTYVSPHNPNDKCCVVGGKASAQDYAGPFYYGMDYEYNTAGQSYNGRLMYQPTYNSSIYLMNIAKWNGGE